MRKRLRDLGYPIGRLPTGPQNSITDVKGVRVGHVTIKEKLLNEEAITSGVTAILPHGGNLFYDKVPAASFVLNGFGKTTGLVQVEELGVIESPIMLTNTFSIPAVTEGTLKYMLEQNQEIGEKVGTINIVVGECNDSFLNDIRGLHIRPNHAMDAIHQANDNIVEEGAVGAGTGMTCFGFKGGIGSSSRVIKGEGEEYIVGALVLTNFGAPDELTILGKPIGRLLKEKNANKPYDGSIIIIIASDAPLDARQLKRLAKRASLGLARTGSIAHNGSGDIIIAFSNGYTINHNKEVTKNLTVINENAPLFNTLIQGVVEASEEAIVNSLFMSETTYGRKNRVVKGLPIDEVLTFL